MQEQERHRDEAQRIEAGAPPRDLSEFGTWRETTDLEVLEALDLYGTYLSGQTNGFSDALPLPSVVAAFDIEGIEPDDRPEVAHRILLIHSRVCEIAEHRRKMAAKHG